MCSIGITVKKRGKMQREREAEGEGENGKCWMCFVLLWLPRVLHQLLLAGCSGAIALRCARVPQNTKKSPVNLPSMSLPVCVCISSN